VGDISIRVAQSKLWKGSNVQSVGKLPVEKMGIGERSVFSLKNSYAPNAMKKGRTLGFLIRSLTKV
jgi:hypothetical protein